MSYQLLKIVHLLGVILFLGNIIVTAVWKIAADRHGDPKVVAFAQRMVNVADVVFTAPGVLFVLAGAYGMAYIAGIDLTESTWINWGQTMFVASGLIWVAILIPTQIAQGRLAHNFAKGGAIPAKYWQLNRRWITWGLVATVLPLANLYVMVVKP